MKQLKLAFPFAAALAVAACQQPGNETPSADTIDIGTNVDTETVPPSDEAGPPESANRGTTINEAEDDPENSPSTAVIPAQYRGRWGINANDCDPRRSDTKGLMTVRANSIRFYESVAALQEQRPAIATSFSGTYSFTGEGQTWERVMTFTRTGDKLKRADNEGSYTYTRCA